MEENTKKFSIVRFLKNSWFFIGIFVIVIITLIVMMSDRHVPVKGDVPYDKPVYYISGNNLYVKERGKDEVLISTTLFSDPDNRTNEDALAAALISPDGEYLYFYENIVKDDNDDMTGDFCVYHNGRKKLIEEDTTIYFAINDDYDKVLFLSVKKGVAGGTGYEDLKYDLYTFDFNKGKELIQKDVMPAWYTISGDGESVVYVKDYDAATDTYSMYLNKDGEDTFINDHIYFYGERVPGGTYRVNWPMMNYDASRLLYGRRMKFNEMTSMYIYKDGTSTMLGKDVLQIFSDEDLSTAVMLHDYKNEDFVGTMSRINLDTLESEDIADGVWGLADVSVDLTLPKKILDLNLYYKNYDSVINTADLCMMTPEGEKVVINATEVTQPRISEDGSTVYGLDYWTEEDGGQLVKAYLHSDNTMERIKYDENVKEMYMSDSGDYLMYLVDDDLFFIGPDDKKVFVDRNNMQTYGFLTGDGLLYYFQSANMGSGNVYVREPKNRADNILVAEDAYYCWDFYDGNIAFMVNFDFANNLGSLYITDGEGNYELIADNVEIPLFYNRIP